MNPIEALSFLQPSLRKKIETESVQKEIPSDTEILRQGQYIKHIPIVLRGSIKVFTRHQEKELLLYYIKPNESCIMSFTAGLKNTPSPVFALTEEETSVLLIPTDKALSWMKDYPDFNTLFFNLYNQRYSDLLDTIHHVLFNKMDERLFDYLTKKSNLLHQKEIKMSHREIANELGTAREVISRVLKKLESEGKVNVHHHAIEIL